MSEGCSGNCSSCHSKGGCGNEKLVTRMAAVKHKIFVLSGKGGVGKSTIAAILAVTLAKMGRKVGLLDVDFHGPSQPTLFGTVLTHPESDGELLYPVEVAGVKLTSLGMLLDDPDSAVIWRGPVKLGALQQLLSDVAWGDLDYLIGDFPPGTGDEALSAAQTVPGSKAAIIVTTPQEVALADCRKCLDFCEKVTLPVAGIVENMSYFRCKECNAVHHLFGEGGGAKLAELRKVPLLGGLPFDPEFLARCDAGNLPAALNDTAEIKMAAEKIAAAVDAFFNRG